MTPLLKNWIAKNSAKKCWLPKGYVSPAFHFPFEIFSIANTMKEKFFSQRLAPTRRGLKKLAPRTHKFTCVATEFFEFSILSNWRKVISALHSRIFPTLMRNEAKNTPHSSSSYLLQNSFFILVLLLIFQVPIQQPTNCQHVYFVINEPNVSATWRLNCRGLDFLFFTKWESQVKCLIQQPTNDNRTIRAWILWLSSGFGMTESSATIKAKLSNNE